MSGNLAIIPVRTGSKRLANKNTRLLDGRPLFVHAIEHARDSGVFDEIHVSTESPDVARVAQEAGAAVPFLRPESLASDTAKLLDVFKAVLETYRQRGRTFDKFCCLWATNPLRTPGDILASLEMFDDETDSVVAGCEFEPPVFCAQHLDERGFLAPLFPDKMWLSSQEMPTVLVDNGTLVWCRTASLFAHDSWMPPHTRPYLMPRSRSVEIDTEDSWRLAEALYAVLEKSTDRSPDVKAGART